MSARNNRFDSNFSKRRIITGRVIDFPFLESVGFPYIRRFEEFGWMDFLRVKEKTYSKLMQMFYDNGNARVFHSEECGETYSLQFDTFVKGQIIDINKETLFDLFKLEYSGELYHSKFDREAACKAVFDEIELDHHEIDAKKLKMQERVLHLILVYNLKPRFSKISTVTREDLWFMWKVIKGEKPNLAHYVLTGMTTLVLSPTKSRLQYGMVISVILNHYKVDITNEVALSPNPNSELNQRTLKSIGYVLKNGIERIPSLRKFKCFHKGSTSQAPPPVVAFRKDLDKLFECWEITSGALASHTSKFASFSEESKQRYESLATRLRALSADLRAGFVTMTERQKRTEAYQEGIEQRLKALEEAACKNNKRKREVKTSKT